MSRIKQRAGVDSSQEEVVVVDEPVGVDEAIDPILVPSVSPLTKLTPMQELAADLVAEVLAPERVDHVLHLPRGSVRSWLADDRFAARAALRRHPIEMRQATADFSAGLTEPQWRAAHMEALGVRSTRIAEALGIHRSTLYNWRRDPIFRMQVEQFRSEERKRVVDADRARRRRELDLAHHRIRTGLRDDVEGSTKLALEVIKLYEQRKER